MHKIIEWSDSEKNWLLDIANTNRQVWSILKDNDVDDDNIDDDVFIDLD